MKIINPYTDKIIGEITLLTDEEINQRIEKAWIAKQEMSNLSSGDRYSILVEIIDGIKEKYEDFIKTIIEESGKPYRYAKGEVDRAIQTFTISAEEAKRIPHELFDLDSTEMGRGLRGELVYFPKGVVFGISPFNFPFNLAAHKIAPAIAAGCPILLKPSSKVPLTMELLNKIIANTALPKGGFQLIHCTREQGNKILSSDKIDVLSFTGSPSVGWEMKKNAGKKHVILELGGNAAAIVDKGIAIQKVVSDLLIGGFAYSGQVCIHTQRIYVHHSVFEEFTSFYQKGIEELKIGNPMDISTDFSVMIDESNAKRVENWVDEALENGATCLVGGQREKSMYPPTLLTNVRKGLKVRDEEVFGPVVIVEPYSTLDEAVNEVNDCRWGLQASIYTNNIQVRNTAFKKLKVGAVIHNNATTFRVDDMPYGGIKDSGFGREGIRYTLKDYLEPKLLVRE